MCSCNSIAYKLYWIVYAHVLSIMLKTSFVKQKPTMHLYVKLYMVELTNQVDPALATSTKYTNDFAVPLEITIYVDYYAV